VRSKKTKLGESDGTKEIDFLPDWYKSGRRRQGCYRTQYLALGGVFVIMMTWNLLAVNSMSRASAAISQNRVRRVQAERVSREFAELSGQLEKLKGKAEVLEQIDSRIDAAAVLAELSFLIGEKVVLSKVEFSAEKFSDGVTRAGARLPARVAARRSGQKTGLLLGDVRFKVVLTGLASEASDFAELTCNLESSEYFVHVIPSFSRNTEIKAGVSGPDAIAVTEFEIISYLANYRKLDGGD